MEVRRVRKVCPSCCQERKGRSTRDQWHCSVFRPIDPNHREHAVVPAGPVLSLLSSTSQLHEYGAVQMLALSSLGLWPTIILKRQGPGSGAVV